MEKLLEIESKHHGNIAFCFRNGQVHIAINDHSDSLPVSILNEVNEKILLNIMRDINIIK